jgi:methylated-DNA-[protein]-cysteine S-methyltransferase
MIAPPPERLMPERLMIDRLNTPIGVALLATDEAGFLRAFDWSDFESRQLTLIARYNGHPPTAAGAAPAAVRRALADYFDGDLRAIDRVERRTCGTAFQLACWRALCDIPAGTTATYGQQAARIGRPKAVRAVGLANGANPIGLVVPCHRVIGADGTLTGYGGGLRRKRWLLRHEGARFRDDGAGETLALDLQEPTSASRSSARDHAALISRGS